jgi:hypothetical protein
LRQAANISRTILIEAAFTVVNFFVPQEHHRMLKTGMEASFQTADLYGRSNSRIVTRMIPPVPSTDKQYPDAPALDQYL